MLGDELLRHGTLLKGSRFQQVKQARVDQEMRLRGVTQDMQASLLRTQGH